MMQKICQSRLNFKHIPFAISGLIVSAFTSTIFISGRIVRRAILLSATVTSASSKTNAETSNLLSMAIYAL